MEQRPREDASDSEDDLEYVPDDGGESSDEGDREVKRQRTSSPRPMKEDTKEKKKAREALWEQFKSSVSAPVATTVAAPRTVKIEKRYRFAGEEVREVKEVPEDSEDARKWPRWQESESEAGPSTASTSQISVDLDAASSSVSNAGTTSTQHTTKANKRPGPRKSKITLAPLPGSQKAKKLTTLDKSAMDWRSHVDATDEPVKDALEANRRGGGYLEKVEFLQRVADRKEDALEATKSTKRRR